MHILVMSRTTLGHSLGGMQKQMMDLCEGFIAKGHQVSVITTARKDGVAHEITDGLETHYLAGCKPEHYSQKWNNLARKKIAEIHQTKPINIIHSQSMGAYGILKWAKKNSVPIVSTWHGTSLTEIPTFFASASYHPRHWHWLLIMPTTMLTRYFTKDLAVRKASKKITLVSPTLEKNMKFFARDKVVTVTNGIELPTVFVKPTTKPIECIAIGRMEKEKGIHYAITAIANLTPTLQQSVLLNVVGEGTYLGDLKKLATKLNVDNSVKFHGRTDDSTLKRIYQKSRIHLMPTTRQEGLPLTILEGMANSMATIASNIGGIPGVITDGVDGILTTPGNQSELDQTLHNLLSNEEMINRIGESARKTTEERYSKQRMIDETLAVLTGVIEK